MKLDIIVADPAKNITILVNTPISKEKRATIASKLMSFEKFNAEQVGFFVEPIYGGDFRLEMMGGEFCGNAIRSAACYHHTLTGKNMIRGEISGCEGCLMVSVSNNGCAWANMPSPTSITEEQFGNIKLPFVRFDGIGHFIAENNTNVPRDRETFQHACTNLDCPSIGLMIFDSRTSALEPFVYVSGTDTLFRENSCASGSAALTAYIGKNLALSEPGGVIETRCKPLSIGGIVNISKEFSVEI